MPFSLRNQFLMAMPSLRDPNFHQSVSLICEHNEEGAMGIIFNRPLELTVGEVLQQMDLECEVPAVGELPIHLGGPVQSERGFVIHSPPGDWDATLMVSDTLAVSSSKDILEDLAKGRGPEHFLVALGYAGWGAGQLERELKDNAWLNGPVDLATLFDVPAADRWHNAAQMTGIDMNLITGDVGHA